MMKFAFSLLCLSLGMVAFSQDFDSLDDFQAHPGFFDFYYDEDQDRIYLEVDRLEEEFLYVHSLSSGMGSNDLGLDRGQIGGEKVVYFQRAGQRMLMIQPNLDYRALSDNALERQAVEQAFARSVIYSFPILDQRGGKFLIDLGPMLQSDAHQVSQRLTRMKQGNYRLDPDKSALELERTRAFPDNVEFDVLLTYSGESSYGYVDDVTPDSRFITLNQHHSFVRLPDEHYQARAFHPGSGCISISYLDYASEVHENIRKQYIIRHRLDADNPIIYYLDNGTPEPIRSALLEGARWWEEAFADIGYPGGYRVEVLPEDADPMDVRYNVIQWVHRATRGWSYGNSVVDPRTGEIIKGHVSLGSLRVRQDFLIAQALLNKPYAEGSEREDEMMDMALARIRQLSAHEVGHTLGFVHNYAASSNERASVMDYPHPQARLDEGEVVLDQAYDAGIGPWDKVTVAYAYQEMEGDEEAGLQALLRNAADRGLRYISDHDARAPGGAHPYAHLWDNGASAVDELKQVLEVRQKAMGYFSVDQIPEGQPLSILEDVFVPLYFYHRYQVEAAVKLVGGLEYTYQVKGDASGDMKAVDPETQQAAMAEVIRCTSPELLMIPRDKLSLFPPRAPGYYRNRESFEHKTGITFDYLAPPAASAHTTLGLLLHPERANRLFMQAALDPKLPGFEALVKTLLDAHFYTMKEERGYAAEVAHALRFIVIDHLLQLGQSDGSYPQVKAVVAEELDDLRDWLKDTDFDGLQKVYVKAYRDQIKEGKAVYLHSLPEIPPGSPIGMDCMHLHD